MEILINELSLNGQFCTIHDFISKALTPIISVLNELDPSKDLIFKKFDFYNTMVTQQNTLHSIVTGQLSRSFDEIRKFKRKLESIIEEPYWEHNPRHSPEDYYFYESTNISGSSLAEACERDRVVISFICNGFDSRNLNIIKKDQPIYVDNLFALGHYAELVRARGFVTNFSLDDPSRFIRTRLIRQGQTVYKETESGYFWYLDNLHKNHFEVFNANESHIGEADLFGNIDLSKSVNGRVL